MKKLLLWIMALLLAWPACVDAADRNREARETIDRRLALEQPGEPAELEVDNVLGAITVTAADQSDIRLQAVRIARAETAAGLEQAGREVRLDVSQAGNRVRIYVDGPFRQKHARSDPGYIVRYEFTLTVPRRTSLRLRGISDGDIRVGGVEGPFDVSHVNGAVRLEGVSGSGRARTVNGAVHAAFRQPPAASCDFQTVNGAIELSLPDGLNADFRLRSINGEAWSDFDVTRRPAAPPTGERNEGRTRFARDRFHNLRVGQGGPLLTLQTVNGDMTIARRGSPKTKTGE